MIEKVISGGQTGCDQAAIFTARELGIPTGGWAPKGWRIDDGPAPWLADFGLIEHESPFYPPRTWANVQDSDGTIIFGWEFSPGCTLTKRACETLKKPVLVVSWPTLPTVDLAYRVSYTRDWLETYSVKVLNVAGNRERMNPGVGEACKAFLREVLQ